VVTWPIHEGHFDSDRGCQNFAMNRIRETLQWMIVQVLLLLLNLYLHDETTETKSAKTFKINLTTFIQSKGSSIKSDKSIPETDNIFVNTSIFDAHTFNIIVNTT